MLGGNTAPAEAERCAKRLLAEARRAFRHHRRHRTENAFSVTSADLGGENLTSRQAPARRAQSSVYSDRGCGFRGLVRK
jgi:hypothetical protein